MKRFGFALIFAMALFSMAFTVYFQVSGQHHHKKVSLASTASDSGPLSSATVTFGGWIANPPANCPPPTVQCPPIDRFLTPSYPLLRFSNNHGLIPEVAKIKAGGSVNFIISGLHVLAVYDDGTKPEDISLANLQPLAANNNPIPLPPVINDTNRRIYRGIDPTLLPPAGQEDRIEAVQFTEPGTYLVICAILPHFQDGMFGYVRVLPNGDTAD